MQQDVLRQQLSQFGQEHLIRYWPDLRTDEQFALSRDLLAIDFRQIQQLFAAGEDHTNWSELAERALPPPAVRERTAEQNQHARALGQQTLAAGEVGVILTAGGQGTRLGFDQPKGLFPIGPLSGASLFQILFEKVVAARTRFNVAIPLYVMTSQATHHATEQYLQRNQFFGLPPEDVVIFQQGRMPAVDCSTGQVLLEDRHRVAFSPDGHGGLLEALVRSKAMADMQRRNLARLFYLQVDNPLTPVCDPELLGCHVAAGSEMTTLAIAKQSSRDKLGNIVNIDGRVQIIEYSELNPLADDIVERQDMHGQPVFWAGNTAIHIFEFAFLQRMTEVAEGLPFHIARKPVSSLNDAGILVAPKEPNALKFERFIFDLLPHAEHALVVEGKREAVFAPLKNASGEPFDSPESVRAQMTDFHRDWLRSAGVEISDETAVEISPRFAFDEDELRVRKDLPKRVTHETYLR
ncbi:MAG: UTP--glucose-1-phosphate uridylyltransferase [Pirellulales bacterium]|nr:UTP--glucose-1-phosphate uridylyltransferase [Pirellulales bacterium]